MQSEDAPMLVRRRRRSRARGFSQSWQQKDAELAEAGLEARRNLIERVARERAFQHLDEAMGRRPEDFAEIFDRVAEGYLSGRFFLSELSLFYEVSPELSLTVFELRREWIRQYELRTIPELMLLDQAMLAYFHTVRMNKESAKMLSLTEEALYLGEFPAARLGCDEPTDSQDDQEAGAEHVRRLQQALIPMIDRFNVMFLRNLRVLRELKSEQIQIHIRQTAQVKLEAKDQEG